MRLCMYYGNASGEISVAIKHTSMHLHDFLLRSLLLQHQLQCRRAAIGGIRGCQSSFKWKPEADNNRAVFIVFGVLVTASTPRMALQGVSYSIELRSMRVAHSAARYGDNITTRLTRRMRRAIQPHDDLNVQVDPREDKTRVLLQYYSRLSSYEPAGMTYSGQ
jgi:hypothetical protein